MTKTQKISFAVLSVLLSSIAALSGFMVYIQLSSRQREKDEFAELTELIQIVPSEPSRSDETPPSANDEPESAQKRDLTSLFAQNSDCIGWLCIPDTQLNYPVMYTPENPEKYLRRNFYGEYSQSGVLFLDWRCGLQSDHLIVYGHNMKNGTMFHDLMNYKQKSFFDEHRIINLLWDGVDTQWEIFVAYIIKPNTIYHISTAFTDDQHFADVMNQTIEYAKTVKPSNADPDVTIKPSDQVLTLSTCTYEYDDSFFAVMARRIK